MGLNRHLRGRKNPKIRQSKYFWIPHRLARSLGAPGPLKPLKIVFFWKSSRGSRLGPNLAQVGHPRRPKWHPKRRQEAAQNATNKTHKRWEKIETSRLWFWNLSGKWTESAAGIEQSKPMDDFNASCGSFQPLCRLNSASIASCYFLLLRLLLFAFPLLFLCFFLVFP